MKLREKYLRIPRADIYVIQECENPETSSDKYYREFAENSIWIGDRNNKGLGVFASSGIKLEKLSWSAGCLKHFLPVRVDDKFNLLAVWAQPSHIEDYFIYQSLNINNFDKRTIIMGDFSTNVSFDKKHRERTHMSVVQSLENIGLYSVYHKVYNENLGQETKPTCYLRKNLDIGYHFSYCFADFSVVKSFEILCDETRIKYSAHNPLVLETDM